MNTSLYVGVSIVSKSAGPSRSPSPHAGGGDDGVGMLIEGDDEREGIVFAGVGDGLPDDLLMTKVHAVEEADRKADFVAAGGQFVGGANQLHGM